MFRGIVIKLSDHDKRQQTFICHIFCLYVGKQGMKVSHLYLKTRIKEEYKYLIKK